MKKVIKEIEIDVKKSKAFSMYFGEKSFAVFDIETTGLSPKFEQVILSGLIIIDGNSCKAIQLFATSQADEKSIIAETLQYIKNVDFIVTYNGKHFDIPFMAERAKKHDIEFIWKGYNLDLYLVLNGYSQLRKTIPNLKQKSVEEYMGLSSRRKDQISGKESVDLYKKYLATGSKELEKQILLHNSDDILQLYNLLPILSKVDLDKAMYQLGFPAGKFVISRISVSGHDLIVRGFQTEMAEDYISFPTAEHPFTLRKYKGSSEFELSFLCQCQLNSLFIDIETMIDESTLSKLERYPFITNGYLIVKDQNKELHMLEINAFLLEFLSQM